MPNLYLMMGLPGLGKSTYAKELMKERKNMIVVSSDDLRECLLQNVERQDENRFVFNVMQLTAISALSEGKDVVYDATNAVASKRRALIQSMREKGIKFKVVGVFCMGDHALAINSNSLRQRRVPSNVIIRMTKQFDIPTKRDMDYLDEIKLYSMKSEGWSSIGKLFDVDNYEEFNKIMSQNVALYEENIGLAQDSSYHHLSVSRHIYEAFNYGKKNIPDELIGFKEHILIALAFHDIGKAVCKEFRNGSRYANFIGHEKVSAQIFMSESVRHKELKSFDCAFIGALIKEHGFAYKDADKVLYKRAIDEIERIYGKTFKDCLVFIRECDQSAH